MLSKKIRLPAAMLMLVAIGLLGETAPTLGQDEGPEVGRFKTADHTQKIADPILDEHVELADARVVAAASRREIDDRPRTFVLTVVHARLP